MVLGLLLALLSHTLWHLLQFQVLAGRSELTAAKQQLISESNFARRIQTISKTPGSIRGVLTPLHNGKSLAALMPKSSSVDFNPKSRLLAVPAPGAAQPDWSILLRTADAETINCPEDRRGSKLTSKVCTRSAVSVDTSQVFLGSLIAGELEIHSTQPALIVTALGSISVESLRIDSSASAASVEIIAGARIEVANLEIAAGSRVLIHSRRERIEIGQYLGEIGCTAQTRLRIESPKRAMLNQRSYSAPGAGCAPRLRPELWIFATEVGRIRQNY